jgi:fatty acid desaturase
MSSVDANPRFWYILGDAYDLHDFPHPGGASALAWSQGQDATFVLISYHLTDPTKLLQRLQKYRAAGAPRWDPQIESLGKSRYSTAEDQSAVLQDPIIKTAKQAVILSGQTACSAPLEAIVFVGIFWILSLAAAWMTLFRHNVLAALCWPVLSWLCSVNMAHDAAHHAAFHRREGYNRLLSYLALPFFFEPVTWEKTHNFSHHLHTNDLQHDGDTKYGVEVGMARHHQRQASRMLMPLTWPLFIIIQLLATSWGQCLFFPLRHYRQRRSCLGPLFLTFVVALPWFIATQSTSVDKAVLSLLPTTMASIIFSVVTQSSHLGEAQLEMAQGSTGILAPGAWGRCQALTSVNYAPESRLWCALTGALNLQSVHHLLPFVHGWRLRKIWPVLRKNLEEQHGIKLMEEQSIFSAYVAFATQLRSASSKIN